MIDNKDIEYLEDWEHILLRPTVYVGSIEPSEDRIPIIHDGRIHIENREISVGFYKMYHEILDNAIDEAKRMKGRMRSISVHINSTTNEVTVADTGDGFHKGEQKNVKTKKSNIETAMSSLRAGSNFKNETTETTLIGTNGFGAAIVNILSDSFSVHSINENADFYMEWNKFTPKKPVITLRTESKEDWSNKQTGTTVTFIPRKKEFRNIKWDYDIIYAQMLFKQYLIKHDPILNGLKFCVTFDGTKMDLEQPFLPDTGFTIDSKIGTLVIYESFENSGSVSFVNSAMCTGMHQKLINEAINKELDDQLGQHFYESFFILNLPPKLVRFRDQNKTRLDSTRGELEPIIKDALRTGFQKLFLSELFTKLLAKVEERKMSTEVKKLQKEKKKTDVMNSTKYFPPSGRPESIFIVEGDSACGSILQKRDTKTEGIYRLKGKIKNVRSVSDLSGNQEVVELMQILDLDLDPTKRSTVYKNVIIATDADSDGGHITALLVNLFFRWFPYIITEGHLYRLRIPLMSVGADPMKREYFFDQTDYDEWQKGKPKSGSLRYLKGLGSLSEEDWEVIMKNKQLQQLHADTDAKRFLEMAFGRDPMPRKIWLEGKFK